MVHFACIRQQITPDHAILHLGYLSYQQYLVKDYNSEQIKSKQRLLKALRFTEEILELKFDLEKGQCAGINLLSHSYPKLESLLDGHAFIDWLKSPNCRIILQINEGQRFNETVVISDLGTLHLTETTTYGQYTGIRG